MPNQVAVRFSDAASRYEQAAQIQKQAAEQFDDWLASLKLPRPNSIAEIGCGTGFFTRLLHRRFPNARLDITDFAPGMVDYCRAGFAPSDLLDFHVCDGRSARFRHAPDWIVSTMCFQWFDPLNSVLEHHLAHSRVLAFSILLDGSFSEWQAAHARLGLAPGLQALPAYDALLATCERLGAKRVQSHRVSLGEPQANGISFANSLRAIGADQPRISHKPVNLRAVCKQLENGFTSNYEIGFFCLEK